MYRFRFTWVVAVILSLLGAGARGAPLEPGSVAGPYESGGVTLTADDIRQIAGWDEGSSGVRGGGIGRVLLVACSGGFGFPTIQAAIDDAVDGDVVVVFPNDCAQAGRWYENIDFLGKAIRVQSVDPADAAIVEATVVDGSAAAPVVRFVSGETTASVLDGFTLVNGIHGQEFLYGAGISCVEAAPTIRRCHLRETPSGYNAVYLKGGEGARLEGCRFVGGLYSLHVVMGNCCNQIEIQDCHFEGATFNAVYLGVSSGITCEPESLQASISGCEFEGAAGVYARLYQLSLTDCESMGNPSAGIYARDLSIADCHFEGIARAGFVATDRATIERSSFVSNTVEGDFSNFLDVSGPVTLRDCEFRSNVVTGRSLMDVFGHGTISNCNFVENVSGGHMVEIRGYGAVGASAVVDSSFRRNTTNTLGANVLLVVASGNPSSEVRNCEIMDNLAAGAPLYLIGGRITDCILAGNRGSSTRASAILAAGSSTSGCTIVGNWGIGPAVSVGNSTISGCTIVGNLGGASAVASDSSTISNSIVYDNRWIEGEHGHIQIDHLIDVAYCDIQDLAMRVLLSPQGAVGKVEGSIDLPPRFIDPGSWDDMGTPDDYSDDVYTFGDYHLLAESPCIDGGDPAYVAALGATDFDGEARVMGCRLDMGVDEYLQAAIAVPGDFDGDGFVTVDDLPAFLDEALVPLGLGVCRADLTGDGFVDGHDVAAMAGLLVSP